MTQSQTAPSPEQIKTALLTEHFRYTPLTLLDEIINNVNEVVFQAVNGIEESLLNVDRATLGFDLSSDESSARTEIETGIVQLESLLNATIDKNFDKLEIYTLRNLLTVSNKKEDEGLENWVQLDHYKGIGDSNGTAGEDTLKALDKLRRQVNETEKLHRALKTEVARNEALLARLKPISLDGGASTRQSAGEDSSFASALSGTSVTQDQPSFSFLSGGDGAEELEVVAKRDSSPLTQNVRFVLSQLPALRNVVAELRPHLGGVPKPGMGSEAERERERYLEVMSRKAMERSGVRLGREDASGDGREVAVDEVKALEALADTLGGA